MNEHLTRKISRPNAAKAVARLEREIKTLIERSPELPDDPRRATDRQHAAVQAKLALVWIERLYL